MNTGVDEALALRASNWECDGEEGGKRRAVCIMEKEKEKERRSQQLTVVFGV